MPIEDLLTERSRNLYTVGPDETVRNAARVLANNDIGALPICESTGKMVGILSERDIVRTMSRSKVDIDTMKVSEIMKTKVISAKPGDRIRDVISSMNENRIRHVPVIKDGKLVAMFSVRDLFTHLLDVTKAQRDTMTLAYEMLR